jgi:hypothetical protein
MLRAKSLFHASKLGGKWFYLLSNKLIIGRGAAYGFKTALFHINGSEGRNLIVKKECIIKEGRYE